MIARCYLFVYPPIMTKKKKKNPAVLVRLSEQDRALLTEIAAADSRPMAVVIRLLIRQAWAAFDDARKESA